MLPIPDPLSRREQEVLRLLMDGMANKEIARCLSITQKTVEEHLSSIYKKLGVPSRTKAVLWGMAQMRDFPH